MDHFQSQHALQVYTMQTSQLDEKRSQAIYEEACAYNTHMDSSHYNNILNPYQTGLMGYLEIPAIAVNLPIYHGSDEAVLKDGIGHLDHTALPIDTPGTHAVLTGHTGYPTKKLLTRLDELVIGDHFTIRYLNHEDTYEVFDIQIVKPEEVDIFHSDDNQTLVSLVTCTPFGINSHRLIVTGKKIVVLDNTIPVSSRFSFKMIALQSFPIIILLLLIYQYLRRKPYAIQKAFGGHR